MAPKNTKRNTAEKKGSIMSVFFNNPSKTFHLREISRITKIPASTASRLIKDIIKNNLIIKKRQKPILELEANLESNEFIREKKKFNIGQIEKSGIVDFLVSKYNEPEAIVLFGSYSRGEDIERSDIDIILITTKQKNPEISKFEKILGRKIHLLEISYKDIKKELFNNLINGVILYGYLKLGEEK
jgi:predicted nucleotidyltransferase